jgi:hypothetical protein
MGSRARKKWQGDLLSTLPTHPSDDEDESDDDDEIQPRTTGFAFMVDESSDDEGEESSSEDDEVVDNEKTDKPENSEPEKKVPDEDNPPSTQQTAIEEGTQEDEQADDTEEEDLDAILDEFQQQDLQSEEATATKGSSSAPNLPSEFAAILRDVDVCDLDVDWSLRHALQGGGGNTTSSSGRRRIQPSSNFVFGAPRETNVRPPHYVGGGMGQTTYDRLDSDQGCIPWPYRCTEDHMSTYMDPSRWYTFQQSDTYVRELEDYRQIEQSGDINALFLFVAHHPFVTPAHLQLMSVLYQTNNSNEAQILLKRCLWVYECAALKSFHKDLLYSSKHALMDIDRPENAKFFEAVWQLVRQAMMTGLHRTSWIVGRYLWALDPWRDPMGVLLVLDSFALSCQTEEANQWIIDTVCDDWASQIWYRDDSQTAAEVDNTGVATGVYGCKLEDMPNWAFSYALALFRVHGNDAETSSKALLRALRAFPSVVGQLLHVLDIDTSGRSFRRDWVTVLDRASQRSNEVHYAYLASDDTITTTATLQASDFIIKVFLDKHTGTWGDDDVLQWLYDNLCAVLDEPLEAPPLCPAIMRYTRFKIPHYETRLQQFPADANIIDPGLVAHAMVIDPNRPRLLRRHQQQQRQAQQEAAEALDLAAGLPMQRVMGGPPTGVVDPDWPIAEVFWRSMLPWNRVEGVPPPRR